MASEISMKIAADWYKEIPREEKCAAMLASFLDSCGVGDAFEACRPCECVPENGTDKILIECMGCRALRKAGLV